MPAILGLLPGVNATLISLSGCCIAAGVYFIRRGRRTRHIQSMTAATALAGVFLVLYLYRIGVQGTTPFPGPAWARLVYLAVLASHLGVALVSTPLVLVTLYRAWRADFARHRRIARIAYPMWLYVAATGVLVYAMLHHWF